ncbi:tetratricopeptide repeat protein [Actinoplanes sp. NPDC000266]
MPESIQSIRRRRRGAAFVGRGAQLAHFRTNLELPETDPGKYFVFNVHGEGGVGKSTLIERWRQMARDLGAVVALVDEHVFDTPEAMSAIMDQLSSPTETKDFRAKYADFLKSRERLESDPQAPRELWSQVVRTGVKAGLHASKALPGAAPIVDLVDGESAADAVDRARQYVVGKIRDFREAKLLLSPAQELSPTFMEALGRIAIQRRVVLFFDTFEQTGVFLEDWLLDVMLGAHGDLPSTVTLVIAGRHPLDANAWSELLDLVAAVPLNPFTDAEARQLLGAQGITDPHTIETILALSGGLPLLTDMLAKGRPASSADVGDPTGTAVERFLKWETDPARRGAALAGALPRLIDDDLLAAAMDDAGVPGLFDWLADQAFVRLHTDRYRYHDVVRHPMIRWQRQRSPQRWREAHVRLADVYRDRRTRVDSEPEWLSSAWQECHAELTYHELCAQSASLESALADGVNAAVAGISVARRYAEALADAGRDAEWPALRAAGTALLEAADTDADDCAQFLTVLLSCDALGQSGMASAFAERARIRYWADRPAEAVHDATEAIRYDPGLAKAYALRGSARGYLGEFEEALADLEEAVARGADGDSTAGQRGEVFRLMGRHEEALSNLGLAIASDPTNSWLIAGRGLVHAQMGRYEAALADFDRAIEISPDYTWALGYRGATYRLAGRYDEALADLDQAVAGDPASSWVIAERGETYRSMELVDEALADLTRAIEMEPAFQWALDRRAETYKAADRHDDAIADFTRTIELDPAYAWALAERGEQFRVLKRYDEAIADFTRAIELDPGYAWAIGSRGQAYAASRHYDEAVADLDRAIELEPSYTWAVAERGETYRLMRRFDEALADFTRAIELDPEYDWAFGQRAQTLREMKRFDEALASLASRLEQEPPPAQVLAERGEIHRHMKRYGEALADFDRAIELDPAGDWAFAQRGELRRQLKQYDAALADLDHAIGLDADDAEYLVLRGLVKRDRGRHLDAEADFGRAARLDPLMTWTIDDDLIEFRYSPAQDSERRQETIAESAPQSPSGQIQ